MGADVQTPADVLRVCNALLATMMERDASAQTIASISRVLTLALTAMTGAQMEERVRELEQIAEAQDANRR
jgi:hypothetical protein